MVGRLHAASGQSDVVQQLRRCRGGISVGAQPSSPRCRCGETYESMWSRYRDLDWRRILQGLGRRPVGGFRWGDCEQRRDMDAATAGQIVNNFVEIVVAPGYDDGALEVFSTKPNLRVMSAPAPASGGRDIRLIEGGALVQERDQIQEAQWDVKHQGDGDLKARMADLELAWTIAAHTKSNAVVLVSDGAAVGVGAGDQSRVGAVARALSVAGPRASGAVAASDAFFPFRDAFDVLAGSGVQAVVEPGGSVRDDEVIAAAVEHDIALLFTGHRHFLH